MLMRDQVIVLPRPMKLQMGLLSYLSSSPSLPSLVSERQAGVTYSVQETLQKLVLQERKVSSLPGPRHLTSPSHCRPQRSVYFTGLKLAGIFNMSSVAQREIIKEFGAKTIISSPKDINMTLDTKAVPPNLGCGPPA